jgi:hypothetical protein
MDLACSDVRGNNLPVNLVEPTGRVLFLKGEKQPGGDLLNNFCFLIIARDIPSHLKASLYYFYFAQTLAKQI